MLCRRTARRNRLYAALYNRQLCAQELVQCAFAERARGAAMVRAIVTPTGQRVTQLIKSLAHNGQFERALIAMSMGLHAGLVD